MCYLLSFTSHHLIFPLFWDKNQSICTCYLLWKFNRCDKSFCSGTHTVWVNRSFVTYSELQNVAQFFPWSNASQVRKNLLNKITSIYIVAGNGRTVKRSLPRRKTKARLASSLVRAHDSWSGIQSLAGKELGTIPLLQVKQIRFHQYVVSSRVK